MSVPRQETFSSTKSLIGSPANAKKLRPTLANRRGDLSRLRKETRQAHINTLTRIAQFTTHLARHTESPDQVKSHNDDLIAHAETAKVWGEIFELYSSGQFGREEIIQKLLQWCLAVPGLKEKFEELPHLIKSYINEFRNADLRDHEKLPKMEGFRMPASPASVKKAERLKAAVREQCKIDEGRKYTNVLENDGRPVAYVDRAVFENWGETVNNTPAVTFIPKSVVGVQNIVKYAKQVNKKVRVSGYRHTWSNIFSNDNEILISLLPLDIATELPSIAGLFQPGPGLLQEIQPIHDSISPDGETILCKLGTATTNEQLREWLLSPRGGDKKWTLPLDVILVEVTIGGTITTICHGAGLCTKTLSDLVAEVEYVDPNGVLRTVSDPELIKVAAGSLGMLGVITSYTVRLSKMTYAAMRPYKAPLELTIPPPRDYIAAARAGDPKYEFIRSLISKHSQETLDRAYLKFIQDAEQNYYAEWFWFPLQPDVWANVWNNDGIKAEASEIPNNRMIFVQWLEEWIYQCINNWPLYQMLPGELQGKVFGFLALGQLPDIKSSDPSLTTELINALHFRRGIQNMQVWDMEWEIPIPPVPSKSDKLIGVAGNGVHKPGVQRRLSKKRRSLCPPPQVPATLKSEAKKLQGQRRDWSVVQRAWWDAILLIEQYPNAVRTALEMRVMGGSEITLAPQRGNDLGTCSIEILTNLNPPEAEWTSFCQLVTNKWISYTDRSTGKRLRARPHWCKQFEFLTFNDTRGRKMMASEWLRKVAYEADIPEFLGILKKIGEQHDFTINDLRSRFGNQYFDNLFWGGNDRSGVGRPHDRSGRILNKFKAWLKRLFA